MIVVTIYLLQDVLSHLCISLNNHGTIVLLHSFRIPFSNPIVPCLVPIVDWKAFVLQHRRKQDRPFEIR